MTLDPYAVLDVPKDADTKTIKRAYRKKAQKHHPDVGGDRAEFDKISTAVAILSDPAKRERYDRTGETDNAPDNAEAAAIQILIQLVSNTVANAAQRGVDPCSVDIVQSGVTAINDAIRKIIVDRNKHQKSADDIQKIIKRLTKKKKTASQMFLDALSTQASAFLRKTAELDKIAEAHTRAAEILNGFYFKVDKTADAVADGPDILTKYALAAGFYPGGSGIFRR